MKRILIAVCTTSILIQACNTETKTEEATGSSATSADTSVAKEKEEAWVPVDSATAMKAWMEYATPGEPHKILAKSNGTWVGEVTMWMSPDGPPQTNTSTMTNKMVMDGRYQLSEYKGDFMGMPFLGMSTTGYDNVKKVFLSTWIDNMGTGILKMEGPWDEASKTISMKGKMIDPSTGRECDMRETLKIIDENNQLMEMYGPDPRTGKEFKSMTVKLTRKK